MLVYVFLHYVFLALNVFPAGISKFDSTTETQLLSEKISNR